MNEQSPKYEMEKGGALYQVVKKRAPNGKTSFWFIESKTRPVAEYYVHRTDSRDPPISSWSVSKDGSLPLPAIILGKWGHWFAASESNDAVDLEELIGDGVHPDLPDKDGYTGCHLSAMLGHALGLQTLLEKRCRREST
eukprot:UN02264